jgi:predicted nuclease with TOPRIM domain
MINLWKKLRNYEYYKLQRELDATRKKLAEAQEKETHSHDQAVRHRHEILAADREITKLREEISRLGTPPKQEDFETLCIKYVHLEKEMRDMERSKNLELQRKDGLRYKALSLLSKKAFKEYCASVENGTRGVDDLVPVLIRDRGEKI